MDEALMSNHRSRSSTTLSIQEAYWMAYVSVIVLAVYATLQACLSFIFGRANPPLKLLLEPYLLCMGLVLHIHWRKITLAFRAQDQERPRWIASADALSFMITFWALWGLTEAFLQKAKLLGV